MFKCSNLKYDAFQKWINVIVHPIGNWWKSVKHSIAWRLLEVAKNGNYHDRLKAVRQLARIDHLKGLYIEFNVWPLQEVTLLV